MGAEQSVPAAPPPRRRWWRRTRLTLRWLVAAYLLTVLAGVPFAWPFDYFVNRGAVEFHAELQLPADGARRVVVLQHGMWRSPLAMLRIERTLAAHGYEVHNLGYPSTAARLEDHTARLQASVEALWARGPIDDLSFVGHSMGGLVIQEYLRSPRARPVARCVYIATPHRGAVLADLRKHWFLFQWAMGDQGALQLSPGDPFHRQPIPRQAASGTIQGDLGAGNPTIPGPDDGTVAVGEATFAGAADSITLPLGHTAIAYDRVTAHQVLVFLRTGAFAKPGSMR